LFFEGDFLCAQFHFILKSESNIVLFLVQIHLKMKKIVIGVTLLIFNYISAQTTSLEQQDLRQREQQAAEKKRLFVANPNTQNYDVRYHKIELTVNPASYYVSGKVTTKFIPNQTISQIVFDLSHVLTV